MHMRTAEASVAGAEQRGKREERGKYKGSEGCRRPWSRTGEECEKLPACSREPGTELDGLRVSCLL